MNLRRRDFLRTTALAGAGVSLSSSVWGASPGSVLGANGDIRVAVVGFNSRGKDHIAGFQKLKGVRLVALCDVDKNVLDAEVRKQADSGNKVAGYTDVRKLLESKEVDVISTATPNHWHALIGIWSCQAGKDVYVEKPVSHNVHEGRVLVSAARKHHRIVQTGTQCRSNPGLQEAIAWIQKGGLGKIQQVNGLCYKPRQSIGKVSGPTPIPAGIDYDLWCGPTPNQPLMREKLHYDWHWVFDTGNGDLGNQGIHQMDIGRWILGEHALSPMVVSVGARLGYVDDGNTPNTQIIYHAYHRAPLIFEVRGLPRAKEFQQPKAWGSNMDDFHGAKVGVVVLCENGRMVIPSYDSAIAYDKDGKEVKRFQGSADHYANFIDAVRARDHRKLNADILEGHLSSALCHTGNISHRLGHHLPAAAIRERLHDDKGMEDAFDRMSAHLKANEIDLAKSPLTLGAVLRMHPAAEHFTNNKAANHLLSEPGRKGFEIPKQV